MIRYITSLLLIAMVIAMSSIASAQVGNYSVAQPANGTYNLTQSPAATDRMWQNSIEDSRWIITTWVEFNGAISSYFFTTLDKSNGTITAPVQIGANGNTGFNGTVESGRAYRPGICWTFDSVAANNGAAIALCEANGGGLNIVVRFLHIDPASVATQPVWQEHPTRLPVNVSLSSGESQGPAIACLDSGDIYVAWRDTSIAGTIGGVSGLNPVAQTPNPNNLPESDIFVRRFSQVFAVSPAALPGMEDVAGGPAASTLNITESTSADWYPDMKAGSGDGVYIAWAVQGTVGDNVANLGTNTGPLGGAVGGETVDVYLALVRNSGANAIQRFSATNVSQSSGPDNTVFNPVLALNRGLNDIVCVVWHDLTITGGIGGNPNLAATDTGLPPFPNQYDIFARTFSSSLVPSNVAKITSTTVREYQIAVVGIDTAGWVIAWSEIVNANDRRIRQHAYDGNLGAKGGVQAYPSQGIVIGGPPPSQFLWNLTSFSSQKITIAFSTSGNPDNLRVGQPQSVTGVFDEYLAVGDVTVQQGTTGILQVSSFIVNNGNTVNKANLPTTVSALVVLRNTSPTATATINNLNVSHIPGWTPSGQVPTMPVTIPPGVTDAFTFQFSPVPGTITSGPNRFTVSASGVVGATSVTAATFHDVIVTGTTGDLAGIQLSYTINPSTFANGQAQALTIAVTVTNGGSDALSSISFSGALPSGITPNTFANLTWTPALQGAFVPGGGMAVFNASVNATAGIAVGSYSPGFTLACNQGIRVGTVSVAPTVALTVLQGTGGGGGGGGGGLTNEGRSCSLSSSTHGGWAGLAILAALAAALVLRRRRMGA